MEVIRRRIEERARVIEEARRWASKLNFKVSVVLIGSYARGDFNLWSDVDIIVVSDELQGKPLERLKVVDSPPGYEVIVWTVSEFKNLLTRKNPLALEAVKGIILRDDYNVLRELS